MKQMFTPHRQALHTLCLLLAKLVIFPSYLPAQQPQWQWAARGGSPTQSGTDIEYADNVEVDKQGNSYVAGRIYSTLPSFTNPYGPPYITANGGLDIFLAKYNCQGILLWVDILGTNGNDWPNGLKIGKDGMIYLYGIVGSYDLTIRTPFDTTSYLFSPTVGVFLSKFNPDGSLAKFQKFNQTATDNRLLHNYLDINNKGNLVIAGYTDTGYTIPGTRLLAGLFLAEVDTSLTPLWAKNFSTPHNNINSPSLTILKAANDGVVMGGYFVYDSIDLSGHVIKLVNGAFNNSLLVKFDSVGNLVWYRLGRSSTSDGIVGLDVDARTNEITALGGGKKNDTILGYVITYPGNAYSMLALLRLDSNGNLLWGKNGNNDTACYDAGIGAIKSDPFSNIYLTGNVGGYIIWDGVRVGSPTGANPYIVKFTSQYSANQVLFSASLKGNPIGTNMNDAYSLAINEKGEVLICGTLSGDYYLPYDTVDMANGGGQTDIFVAKFGLDCADTNALIPPLDPGNLVATATGPQAITVSWQNNAQYVQRFRIYRSLDDINWYILDSVPAAITTYIDINVQANIIYWYKASAVNNAGESQFTNSDSAEIILTGIADITSNTMQMLILPNPNKGAFTLTVAADENSNAQLTIYSIDGRQVLAQPLQITAGNNWYPVQMQGLSAGIYIAQIMDVKNGVVSRKKFVVE